MKQTVAVRGSAVVLAALLALPSPAGAGKIRESTAYFMVNGSTLAELDRELFRRGPMIPTTGMRHAGSTEVKFDGRVTYEERRSDCVVDRADLDLQLVMTVPRWRPSKTASGETRLIWTTLQDDIVRHEREHAAIAKVWLKKIEGAIRNLKPEASCAALEQRVDAVSRAMLDRHERAQREFDLTEGRGMTLRLKRALRDRSREIATR